VNPHAPASLSLLSLVRSLWVNHELILQMTQRDVIGRYKGSVLGILWSFINPIFLLSIYTFVFSVVFNARWGIGEPESKTQFAILLFVGMIVHSLFSETLIRAPSLIVSNVSYVKKIVFPLEILPVVAMGASLFHSLISLLVLAGAVILINGSLPWAVIWLPLVFLPMIILTLGLAWVLASLGVFMRDVTQPIGLAMTILMFASPVFYPVTALPEYLQPWLMLNPLTFIIEQARLVLVYGQLPDMFGLLIYSVISLASIWVGYVWFQKTRKGFADVL
jgi:lipopolysaccharide transport system permease protein